MIKKVPDQWKEYRRRSRIASFGLVLGLPAVTAIAIAIKLWFPINAEDVFIGLAITWAIIWHGLHFALCVGHVQGAASHGCHIKALKLVLSAVALIAGFACMNSPNQRIQRIAKRCNCSVKSPCIISLTKQNKGYEASVLLYGGIITEYGALKFIPSKICYLYDLEGTSFTVAVRLRGFDVLCHLAFSLRLI